MGGPASEDITKQHGHTKLRRHKVGVKLMLTGKSELGNMCIAIGVKVQEAFFGNPMATAAIVINTQNAYLGRILDRFAPQ